MTQAEINFPDWKKRRRIALIETAILILGFFLYVSLTYDDVLTDGLLFCATIGIPAVGFVALLTYILLRLVLRGLRVTSFREWRTRILLFICLVIFVSANAEGVRESRPLNRFAEYVINPPPPSLANLRHQHVTSFNAGGAWFFAFTVNSEDLGKLISVKQLHLVENDLLKKLPVSATKGDRDAAIDQFMDQLDLQFPRWAPGLYNRPANCNCYRHENVTMITDRSNGHVYLFVDYFFDRDAK